MANNLHFSKLYNQFSVLILLKLLVAIYTLGTPSFFKCLFSLLVVVVVVVSSYFPVTLLTPFQSLIPPFSLPGL